MTRHHADIGTDRPLDEYVEAEVQRLLTEDERVAEQGLTVSRREHTLVLTGEVDSTQRRDEIVRLVREQHPGIDLQIDIGLTRANAPAEVEELT